MSLTFTEVTSPAGLIVITPYVYNDERGFFMETFRNNEFEKLGIKKEFVQDNHSKSLKGVIRGLHFQVEPSEQSKLVRCIRGEVYDVAVDLRKKSDSFGKWYGLILSEANKKMLYIPKGYAHGYSALSEEAEVVYKVDEYYSRDDERGIRYDDPKLAIDWKVDSPMLSTKDKGLPGFGEEAEYF